MHNALLFWSLLCAIDHEFLKAFSFSLIHVYAHGYVLTPALQMSCVFLCHLPLRSFETVWSLVLIVLGRLAGSTYPCPHPNPTHSTKAESTWGHTQNSGPQACAASSLSPEPSPLSQDHWIFLSHLTETFFCHHTVSSSLAILSRL